MMQKRLDLVTPPAPEALPRDPLQAEPGVSPMRQELPPSAEPPRAPRRRGWMLGVLLVALVAVGGWLWQSRQTATATLPATAKVVVGSVEETVLATGTLKPISLVAVGSQVSGRITNLTVAVGDEVPAGGLIAEIDPATRTNDLRTAQAALAAARAEKAEEAANLDLQTRTLERQQRLATARTVSEADLDTARNDVAVTEARIAALDARISAAEVAVETAQVNLDYTRITAPIAGTVLAVAAQQGQTVNAVQSTPTIVVLGALDTMAIHAEVSEADVARVSPGQKAWFTILGEPEIRREAVLGPIAPAPETITEDSSLGLTGDSSSSSSSSNSQAVYYDAVFTVPNPDRKLRTYMTAEVHIVLDRADGVLTVPSAALGALGADGMRQVQVQRPDGSLELRSVTVGLNDRTTAEIRAGLAEGESVVTTAPATGPNATRAPTMRPPMGL